MKMIISLLLLVSTSAFAGHETGNGGDVVVCKKADGTFTYELLDLYELREVHGLKPDFASFPRATYVEKAKHQIDKLSEWSDYNGETFTNFLQDHYLNKLENVHTRIKFIQDDLEDIPDSYNTYLPNNCMLKQIAINYQNGVIAIDERLWNALDEDNKSALILHELFYEDFIRSGHRDSIITRQFNAYLHGNSKSIGIIGVGRTFKVETWKVENLIMRGIKYRGLKERLNIIRSSMFYSVKTRLIWGRDDENGIYMIYPDTDEYTLKKFTLKMLSHDRYLRYILLRELSNSSSNIDFENKWLDVKKFILTDMKLRHSNRIELGILSKFKFTENNDFETIYDIYKFQRKCIGCDNLEVFNNIFIKFENLPDELFEILKKDLIKDDDNYKEYRAWHAISLIYDLTFNGYQINEIYLEPILDHINGEEKQEEIFYILWHSALRKEVIPLMTHYLDRRSGFFDYKLKGLFSSFHHYQDLDQLLRAIDLELIKILKMNWAQTRRDIIYSIYGLFRRAKISISSEFSTNLVDCVKQRTCIPDNTYGSFDTLDLLVLENNSNDEIIDLFGYLLRFQTDLYGSQRIISFINAIPSFTDYLSSSIAVELKRNLSDFILTEDLLMVLKGRVLNKELLDIVKFIARSNQSERIRELAQSILDQQT